MANENDIEKRRQIQLHGAGCHPVVENEVIEGWVREYGEGLKRFFVKRGVAPSEADDLTQDVYVRIARMNNVKSVRDPQAFLFQTASNLLRDSIRRSQTRQSSRHVSVEESQLATEVSAPDRVLEGKQSLEGVMGVLAALTVRQRAVFMLHRFEGMTYSQIGRQLGISTSAVEKHMIKAIAQIHQCWEDW